MEENSLCADGWLPPQSGGLTFFHSETDEVVPYSNLETVHEMWDTASRNYSSYLLTKATTYYHKAAGVQFMISYSGSYTNEILSGKWTSIHKKL